MSSDNKISDVVADFEMLTVTNYVPYNLRRRTSKKNPATEVLNRRWALKNKKFPNIFGKKNIRKGKNNVMCVWEFW